jgi:hypothetical protein
LANLPHELPDQLWHRTFTIRSQLDLTFDP